MWKRRFQITLGDHLDPWRDFNPDEQRAARNLLRMLQEDHRRRYEVSRTRDGSLQITEVKRTVIAGRDAAHTR